MHQLKKGHLNSVHKVSTSVNISQSSEKNKANEVNSQKSWNSQEQIEDEKNEYFFLVKLE